MTEADLKLELTEIAALLKSTGLIAADATVGIPSDLISSVPENQRTPASPQLGWRPPYEGDPTVIRRPQPLSKGQVAMLALARLENLANNLVIE